MALTLIAPKVGAAFKRSQFSRELKIQGVIGERIFGISWLTISLSGELGGGDHSLLLDIAIFSLSHTCVAQELLLSLCSDISSGRTQMSLYEARNLIQASCMLSKCPIHSTIASASIYFP